MKVQISWPVSPFPFAELEVHDDERALPERRFEVDACVGVIALADKCP
jgi:hypothetical protein